DVLAEGLITVTGSVTSNDVLQPGVPIDLAAGRYRATTFSTSEGGYRVEGVPAGQVMATAHAGLLSGSATGAEQADGHTLVLDGPLRDSVAVAGTLLAAGGTGPGVVSEITAYPAGGGSLSVFSDPAGSFHFDRLPVGTVRFDALAVGGLDRGRITVAL